MSLFCPEHQAHCRALIRLEISISHTKGLNFTLAGFMGGAVNLPKRKGSKKGRGSLRRVYKCLETTAEDLIVELGWGRQLGRNSAGRI